MSKKKSLGSSPIGFKSENGSDMGFIPDLGVSDAKQSTETKPISRQQQSGENKQKKSSKLSQNSKSKKKITSYNLEIEVISKVKQVASEHGMYYSTLVNMILKSWFREK